MNPVSFDKIDLSEILWHSDGSLSVRGRDFTVRKSDAEGRMSTLTAADITPELQLQIAAIVNVALKTLPSQANSLPFTRIEYSNTGVIQFFNGKEKVKEFNVDELPDGEVKSESLKLARFLAELREQAAALQLEALSNNNNNI